MKHAQIVVGQDYEVETSPGWGRLARVLEVGEFRKTVYGRREFRGHQVTVKGARIAWIHDGEPQLTKVERDRVWGEKESTYIDPYDGATVTVPATEDTWTEKEVDATVWVESRQVTRTAEQLSAALKNRQAVEARKQARDAERDEMHPHIERKLERAGISKYRASKYADGGEVTLSYRELIALIASECATFQKAGE